MRKPRHRSHPLQHLRRPRPGHRIQDRRLRQPGPSRLGRGDPRRRRGGDGAAGVRAAVPWRGVGRRGGGDGARRRVRVRAGPPPRPPPHRPPRLRWRARCTRRGRAGGGHAPFPPLLAPPLLACVRARMNALSLSPAPPLPASPSRPHSRRSRGGWKLSVLARAHTHTHTHTRTHARTHAHTHTHTCRRW